MSAYYEVGHVVTFPATDGGLWTARVVAKVDALWDGQPGFIAQPVNDLNDRVWGLDSEILEVQAPARPTDEEIRQLAATLEAIAEHPKVRQYARTPAHAAAQVLRWVLGEFDPGDDTHYVATTRESARHLNITPKD